MKLVQHTKKKREERIPVANCMGKTSTDFSHKILYVKLCIESDSVMRAADDRSVTHVIRITNEALARGFFIQHFMFGRPAAEVQMLQNTGENPSDLARVRFLTFTHFLAYQYFIFFTFGLFLVCLWY